MNIILNAAGWMGAALTLLAYGLLILERLNGTGVWFNLMNMMGGLLLLGSAVSAEAFPNLVINLVWIAAGFYGLLAHWRRSRANKTAVQEIPTQRR